MKSEWKSCQLYEVADIVDSLHKTPQYTECGIPMLRVTDIKEGYLSLSSPAKVSPETYDEFTKKHRPKQGDVVVSRVGTYGVFAYVATKDKFCLGQNTAIIIPHINEKFLYYSLISAGTKKYLNKIVTGSTQKTISLKNIKAIPLSVPNDTIQERIADILSALDDKIELNNKINENLERQARALYKAMFSDNPNVETTKGVLSDIAEITMGQSPSGSSYNEEGNGEVFYQGRAEFGFRFPTRRLFTTQPKRMAETDDVLLSVRAPVGDLNVAYEQCCVGRGLGAIHSKNGNNSFLLYTMFALKPQLDVFNGEGTVFGSINKDGLSRLPVDIPCADEIAKFETAVRPMDDLIRTNYEENCRLQMMRDSLLPRLMSGEIDVEDVNI